MIPISVCIITKNEENNIKECLSRLTGYPFELIVVDTGSTDNTVPVATALGATVHHFTWCNDFSAARNFSISKASNDWILVFDSDEFVTKLDLDALYNFTAEHPDSIGRIERHSPDSTGSITVDYVERFFNRKLYHYERPIHEQVLRIDQTPVNYATIPVVVDHSGYSTKALAQQKSERNIALLKEDVTKNPDDIYSYFQLGQAYYMAQDYKAATPYFEKALSYDLNPQAEYVQMLVVSYGYTLINTDRLDDAIMFLNQIYPYFKNYGDFVYLLGCCYIRSQEYIKAIQQFVQATTLSEYKTEGVTSYLALYNLGLLYEALGETEMAITFFQNASIYPPAVKELKRLQDTKA